jgi:chorismate mutase
MKSPLLNLSAGVSDQVDVRSTLPTPESRVACRCNRERWRARDPDIDDRILELLAKRASVVRDVAPAKQAADATRYDPERARRARAPRCEGGWSLSASQQIEQERGEAPFVQRLGDRSITRAAAAAAASMGEQHDAHGITRDCEIAVQPRRAR